MTHDYFICKELCIYFRKERNNFSITLERHHGYYFKNQSIQNHLIPKIPPIVIYEYGKFKTVFVEKKYKAIIENELIMNNYSWLDIVKIVKEERRYEMD